MNLCGGRAWWDTNIPSITQAQNLSASQPLSQFSSVQSLSRVRLIVTPWTAARQASLSITKSQSLLTLMSIELVMPSKHLILCRPLLLPPSIFPVSGSFQMSQFFPWLGTSKSHLLLWRGKNLPTLQTQPSCEGRWKHAASRKGAGNPPALPITFPGKESCLGEGEGWKVSPLTGTEQKPSPLGDPAWEQNRQQRQHDIGPRGWKRTVPVAHTSPTHVNQRVRRLRVPKETCPLSDPWLPQGLPATPCELTLGIQAQMLLILISLEPPRELQPPPEQGAWSLEFPVLALMAWTPCQPSSACHPGFPTNSCYSRGSIHLPGPIAWCSEFKQHLAPLCWLVSSQPEKWVQRAYSHSCLPSLKVWQWHPHPVSLLIQQASRVPCDLLDIQHRSHCGFRPPYHYFSIWKYGFFVPNPPKHSS